MALSAARNTWMSPLREGELLRIPMAADAVIYLGGMVCVDGDGYAVAAADTADYKYAGICVEDPQNPRAAAGGVYDNTDGDDGDMEVVVRRPVRFRMPLALRTPQQDMLFAKVYVYDDNHVAVHQWDVANDILCGHIVRLPGTTLAAHPEEQFATDEVEVEAYGEPFDWGTDLTTTSTTTAQA